MFIPSIIKSIQRVAITVAAGNNTGSSAITSVDINNTKLHVLGNTTVNGGSGMFALVQLASSTLVTATQIFNSVSDNIINVEVIQYYSGFIRSIQRGTILTFNALSNTQAVSAVGAKAELVHLGFNTSDNASGNMSNWNTSLELTSNVLITCFAGSVSNFQNTSYELIDWR